LGVGVTRTRYGPTGPGFRGFGFRVPVSFGRYLPVPGSPVTPGTVNPVYLGFRVNLKFRTRPGPDPYPLPYFFR